MGARSAYALVLGGALGALSGCSVDEIDFSSKRCPCDDGFECDSARNRCVPRGTLDAGGGSGGGGGSAGAAGAAGASGSGGCGAGQRPCNGSCVLDSDPSYGCGDPSCSPCAAIYPNGNPGCDGGACTLGSCNPGWDDCDGEIANGCELPVDDDLNCGACNRTCSLDNATATACQAAECAPSCLPGFLNCETPSPAAPDDGCETSASGDDNHCGICGNDCGAQGLSCFGTSCGCATTSDCLTAGGLNGNCNSTLHLCVCGGTSCNAGEVCAKVQGQTRCRCNGGAGCTAGDTCCPNTGCVDLTSDPNNCGVCGKQCAGSLSCTAGVCS